MIGEQGEGLQPTESPLMSSQNSSETPKMIVFAAAQAQKAADRILG